MIEFVSAFMLMVGLFGSVAFGMGSVMYFSDFKQFNEEGRVEIIGESSGDITVSVFDKNNPLPDWRFRFIFLFALSFVVMIIGLWLMCHSVSGRPL